MDIKKPRQNRGKGVMLKTIITCDGVAVPGASRWLREWRKRSRVRTRRPRRDQRHLHLTAQMRFTATGLMLLTATPLSQYMPCDGGLGAILNVQTVKFHDNTIIALEDIIRVANLPDEKKSGLISKLRELPADAIKHLTLQLLTKGVLNLPAALPIIEKFLRPV